MPILDADRLVAALRGAFARDVGRIELLRLAAEKIRAAGAPYTSVYLYMLHGEELVLEPFNRLIEGGHLMAYKYEGFWRAMDTLRDRQLLEDMVERGNMPWRRQLLKAPARVA